MLVDRFLESWSQGTSCEIQQAVGGLAQLGERYNGIVEVIGSSPLSSTSTTFKK